MTVFAIISAVLIILAFLRLGVNVEYSADGLLVEARAGLFTISLYPKEEKPDKLRKKALRAARKARKKKELPVEKKPGSLRSFLDMLPYIRNMLDRIRRRLLINRLTINYIAASENPAVTALSFGVANAAYGAIEMLLERNFRIKRSNITTSADFEATRQNIYIYAAVSLAVWEAVYIAFALLPLIIKINESTRS